MTALLEQPTTNLAFAIVDVETTGFDPSRHRIIELAVVGLDAAGVVARFDSLVRPDMRIGNRSVHGINNRDVRKAPELADVAGSLCETLTGRVLVAYNMRFDSAFLGRELGALGVRWPLPSICSMEIHRALTGQRVKLDSACRTHGLAPPVPQHTARADAFSTAELFERQLIALRARGVQTLRALARYAPRAVMAEDAPLLTADEAKYTDGHHPPWPRQRSRVASRDLSADRNT